MAEILPTGANTLQTETTVTKTQEDGQVVQSFSGVKADVDAHDAFVWQFPTLQFASMPGVTWELVSSNNKASKGRGNLEVVYRRIEATVGVEGVQELYGVDVVRDILSAPYFATLTNSEMLAVRAAYQAQEEADAGWSELQKRLYGHLVHGQEQYIETYYELRWTIKTTSRRLLQVNAENTNTVQDLPDLGAPLNNLIGTLPPGEWLYKPVQIVSLGRQGWQVVRTWQWAKKWSVIYGGTFTGEDA